MSDRAKASRADKRRRRQRTVIAIVGYGIVALGLAWFFESQATTTILFVRHADTDVTTSDDNPGLSVRGVTRAEELADFVQDIDVVAGVDAIYASEFKRTQQTAATVARRLEVEVEIANPYEVEAFMADVLSRHKGEIVLVVTHSDAIAPLIEELHGSKNVPEIATDEFDNFYIVTIPWFGKVKTLRLHYGTRLAGETSSMRRGAPL
ncbi:MAG TPA: phosphoglycerate mutase family protein [Gammaproteobacteria bacterium]|nr:phosphoglycerate mutase family protein [Gammaproteobacteria bacterium]